MLLQSFIQAPLNSDSPPNVAGSLYGCGFVPLNDRHSLLHTLKQTMHAKHRSPLSSPSALADCSFSWTGHMHLLNQLIRRVLQLVPTTGHTVSQLKKRAYCSNNSHNSTCLRFASGSPHCTTRKLVTTAHTTLTTKLSQLH